MNAERRNFLYKTLFGSGYVGLRALATGLPIAAFTRSPQAWAQYTPPACADKSQAQYLIVSTSGDGDPVNANVPGTYDFADIIHPKDPRMAAVPLKLGTQTHMAAAAWGALPPWVLERTCFFHHATLTNSHPNQGKVLRLMGATVRQEMLPSVAAKHLAPCLGTSQTEPVSTGAGDVLTYEGRGLPNIKPVSLRDILAKGTGPLATLQNSRDKHLDRLYGLVKETGTKVQRDYVDSLAISRNQARALSSDLLDGLAEITSDQEEGQIVAAVTLIRMNVSPVVAVRFRFGGDNHNDIDLVKETDQTVSGVQHIAALCTALKQHGLEDKVTFMLFNVFGRTLKKLGYDGRDHWGSHHASVIIGKGLKPGVVGGVEPKAGDYYATPIDSKTGRGVAGGGDIAFGDTLGALGKTVGRAVGLSKEVLDQQIGTGKIVTGALV